MWDKRELIDYLKAAPSESQDRPRRVIRPANLQPGLPGYGVFEGVTRGGVPYAVVQLMGRVFMSGSNDPFTAADNLLAGIKAKVVVVDFHAEATSEKVAMGWSEVLRADSTIIEKLDALSWINTNAMDRFADEFRIQLAWMRQSPPDTPNPGWLFTKRVRQMKSLLAEGIESGEISIDSPSNDLLARSVIGVGWIPESTRGRAGAG